MTPRPAPRRARPLVAAAALVGLLLTPAMVGCDTGGDLVSDETLAQGTERARRLVTDATRAIAPDAPTEIVIDEPLPCTIDMDISKAGQPQYGNRITSPNDTPGTGPTLANARAYFNEQGWDTTTLTDRRAAADTGDGFTLTAIVDTTGRLTLEAVGPCLQAAAG